MTLSKSKVKRKGTKMFSYSLQKKIEVPSFALDSKNYISDLRHKCLLNLCSVIRSKMDAGFELYDILNEQFQTHIVSERDYDLSKEHRSFQIRNTQISIGTLSSLLTNAEFESKYGKISPQSNPDMYNAYEKPIYSQEDLELVDNEDATMDDIDPISVETEYELKFEYCKEMEDIQSKYYSILKNNF